MKASKIITLGLVAASAGLIMGTVALPAQAASVDRVVNVQLTNRPDYGKDGNYRALNHLLRQIKITESAPGEYKVTVRDNGLGRRWLSLLGHPNLGAGAVAIAPRATLHAFPPRRTMTVVAAQATDPYTPDPSASPVPTPTT